MHVAPYGRLSRLEGAHPFLLRRGPGLGLSVDGEVHRLRGRYGVDYPEHTCFERERPVVEAIRERFTEETEAGNEVVLGHGLWRRNDRDVWRQAARKAWPVVVCLPADREELLRRLAERNQCEDTNALTISLEAVDDFFARFAPRPTTKK
ncbi:AAA family ATPase [Streptomyces sp. NPDC002778]